MLRAAIIRVNAYRNMVREIVSFEGWRGLRWPLTALAWIVAALAFPAAAAIVALEIHSVLLVVAVAVVAAVALAVLWDRRSWWWVLVHRQAAWLDGPMSVEMAWLNLRPEDHRAADFALRRAHLNGRAGNRLHQGPDDALDLNFQVHVRRPDVATRHLDATVSDATRATLRRAGIRARIDGVDV
ncbi:MAG TPA: hypothetical protein VMU65_08895 [Candidatus Saccharimonadales bacterium]|nr:hypothetical protein [Candidatus Saccharimonadales bacterium]